MAYIQKANVVLNVKDEEVGYYLNLGYNQIDERGNVIKETIPTDLHTLQKAYKDNKEEIAKLNQEIDFLRKALASMKEVNPTDDAETKPKVTRAKRTEK